MGALKKGVTTVGYDQEEYYFHKKEAELIEKMKNKAKLTLIKGGKEENAAQDTPPTEENTERKKTG